MEYMVAWDSDLRTFIGVVNSHLEIGWQLRGGIAVGPSPEGDKSTVFFQALSRRKESEFQFGGSQDED